MALGQGIRTALAFACLVGASPVKAQEGQSVHDRFELWAECASLFLVVEDVGPNAASFGLTWDAVRFAVESRLRAARVYRPEPGDPALWVVVSGTSRSYSVIVALDKPVRDLLSQEVGIAITWVSSSFGAHTGNAAHILGVLSGHLDKFIAEYLRVNEAACSP